MHADHHESLLAVLVRPGADVGHLTQPVDAGVSPEVDQHHLAAEFRFTQAPRIAPLGRAIERLQLAPGAWSKWRGHHPLHRPSGAQPTAGDGQCCDSDQTPTVLIDALSEVSKHGYFSAARKVSRHCCSTGTPSRAAICTRAGSDSAFIFRITCPRCALTVTSLMPSSPPTCLFSRPETTNAITSRSRGVRDAKLSRSTAILAAYSRALRLRSSARPMAGNSTSPLNGLVRNSMAPAFMARTVVGMSP